MFVPRKYWNYPFVRHSKEKKLKNFQKFMVYKVVKDIGQPFIIAGWVVTEKMIDDERRCKACLIVHGNQTMDDLEIRRDSPTVKKSSLRIQFFLAAQFRWVERERD